MPATVASASQVGTLVVDEDRIFFTTASDVQRCLVGTQVMCASLASPAVVAAAAQSGGGGGGGGPNPMPAPRALAPRALALYGDRFFVAEQANGIVFACPKSGCTPSVIGAVRPRSTPSFAGGLAVDSSSVVWGDRDGLGAGSFPQAGARESGSLLDELQPRDVTRVDMLRSGAAFEDVVFRSAEGVFVLPADQDAPIGELLRGASVGDFALDPRFLYAATNGAVIRVDRATKAKVTLLELAGASIAHVVADGKGVYATVRNGGVERLVRVREGAVDTLVIGSELGAIGLSAQWVYFANKSGIARVAR